MEVGFGGGWKIWDKDFQWTYLYLLLSTLAEEIFLQPSHLTSAILMGSSLQFLKEALDSSSSNFMLFCNNHYLVKTAQGMKPLPA